MRDRACPRSKQQTNAGSPQAAQQNQQQWQGAGAMKHQTALLLDDRLLPAGEYEVITDEETIEGLSFEAFRRVATMISVPAEGARGLVTQRFSIGSVELADAQRIDASASDG
jgi:hypothetical protein